MIAPPSSVKSESPPPNAGDTRLSLGDRDLSPSAEESGALNLTKGSAAAGKGWSPPSPPGPGTPSSGQANHHIATPKSPQGYRPASYNSSDLCVVCGDRASGKKKFKKTKIYFLVANIVLIVYDLFAGSIQYVWADLMCTKINIYKNISDKLPLLLARFIGTVCKDWDGLMVVYTRIIIVQPSPLKAIWSLLTGKVCRHFVNLFTFKSDSTEGTDLVCVLCIKAIIMRIKKFKCVTQTVSEIV